MDKMRIYELARELKVENKDVINYAKKLGLEIKSHMSTIEGDILKKVKEKFTSESLPKTDRKQVKKSDEKEKKEPHKQEVAKTSDKNNIKKDNKKKKTRVIDDEEYDKNLKIKNLENKKNFEEKKKSVHKTSKEDISRENKTTPKKETKQNKNKTKEHTPVITELAAGLQNRTIADVVTAASMTPLQEARLLF